MASWITGVSEGKITVDQEKAAAFVKDLASRYDTAGTARTVTKAAGGQAEITGPYGWKIDQAAETAALMELVSSGSCWSEGQAQADREPVYSQKAASREGTDWGTTYVEVDLGASTFICSKRARSYGMLPASQEMCQRIIPLLQESTA